MPLDARLRFRARCRTQRSRASFRRSPRRVLCPLRVQTHVAPFDSGFEERGLVLDEISSRRGTKNAEQLEKFRSPYAAFVESVDEPSIGCDRSDDSGLSLRHCSMQTERTGASGSSSRERYKVRILVNFLLELLNKSSYDDIECFPQKRISPTTDKQFDKSSFPALC